MCLYSLCWSMEGSASPPSLKKLSLVFLHCRFLYIWFQNNDLLHGDMKVKFWAHLQPYAYPFYWFCVGVLYRDAGDIAWAINAYKKCLKIDPDSRNVGQMLARCLVLFMFCKLFRYMLSCITINFVSYRIQLFLPFFFPTN